MTFGYRIELTPDDNGAFLVTCPSIPELTTFGQNKHEALEQAGFALDEALAARMAVGAEIPDPDEHGNPNHGPVRDIYWAAVTALSALKVLLYQECRRQGKSRADLRHMLGWHREQVDRLFRLDHASRLDQIEQAFSALHCDISMNVIAQHRMAAA